MSKLSHEILKEQNASTSNAIIEEYKENPLFTKLATFEGNSTLARDKEDDVKLAKGIRFAQQKGVLDPKHKPEPYTTIDVLGKTPDQVAGQIMESVESSSSKKKKGSVIVLCGLSGTGKGTTVSKLREQMEAAGHKVVTWSNGNIFRSVTLLAATWCERQGLEGFNADKALTKDNLQDFMSMLSFGKFRNNTYDTRIRGLGLELYVSDVQNTELKAPRVGQNIPTVAEVTQGEVVLFAAQALETLSRDGWVVLLEGREATVNYVPTPHRFTLTLSDESLIGKRRAAQRLMGAAVKEDATEDVSKILDKLLEEMTEEIQEEGSSSLLSCFRFSSKK